MKTHTLKNVHEFQAVSHKGIRVRCFVLSFKYIQNNLGYARIGQAMAVKRCHGAVARNKMRRINRELFKKYNETLGSVDIMVFMNGIADKKTALESFPLLRKDWLRLAQKIQGQLQAQPQAQAQAQAQPQPQPQLETAS